MAGRLSFRERCRIEILVEGGASAREIGDCLGRAESTVRREITRGGGWLGYTADGAQADADTKAKRPKTPKLAADPQLGRKVTELLERRWSPHAIAAWLCRNQPDQRACAETIYKACYDPRGGRGLPAGSWKLLPRQRRRRRSRYRCEQAKRNQLGDITNIRERPGGLTGRLPGHWEGDLLKGAHNRSAVVTLTERTTRYTLLAAVPDSTADKVTKAVTKTLKQVPTELRQSLTWDQGREMVNWEDLQEAIGAPVYFCDRRAPWQRPTNEHTNGMLRRWLPKKTNLNIGQKRLTLIQDNLNQMPRRLHQWQTPQEHYNRLTASNHP